LCLLASGGPADPKTSPQNQSRFSNNRVTNLWTPTAAPSSRSSRKRHIAPRRKRQSQFSAGLVNSALNFAHGDAVRPADARTLHEGLGLSDALVQSWGCIGERRKANTSHFGLRSALGRRNSNRLRTQATLEAVMIRAYRVTIE